MPRTNKIIMSLNAGEIDEIRSGTFGGGGQVMPVLFED